MNFLSILSIAILCSLCHAATAQQFRTATYNLRMDTPNDAENQWANRKAWVGKLIEFHQFDIFGTQEGFKHQLEDLQKALPHYEYIGVGRDDGKNAGEHCAIFYDTARFEIIKHGDFWLSEVTDRPNKGWDAVLPRICTWGLFEDKTSGFTFMLFNAHFDHRGVQARKESTQLIIRKAAEIAADSPMIIMGDFNVDQHNESYHSLQQSGTVQDSYTLAELKYAPNGTFNGFDINRVSEARIDHLFVSAAFSVLRYGILTDSYEGRLPSDHYPVVVDLSY